MRDKEPKFENLFEGFQNNFVTSIGAYLLIFIYVFLWTLLLIIPGIIATLAYSQTFYILAEDDKISASEALKKSKEMMDGYKAKFFLLGLLSLLVLIVGTLALGIGLFWAIPFVQVSYANFYENLKKNDIITAPLMA